MIGMIVFFQSYSYLKKFKDAFGKESNMTGALKKVKKLIFNKGILKEKQLYFDVKDDRRDIFQEYCMDIKAKKVKF